MTTVSKNLQIWYRLAGRIATAVLAGTALLLLFAPASALAETQSPLWMVTGEVKPTNLKPGGQGKVVITVQNVGGAPSDGSTVTVNAGSLPAGAHATAAASARDLLHVAANVSCSGLSCTYSAAMPVDDFLRMTIPVEVEADAAERTASETLAVSGGGAPATVHEIPIPIDSTPARFDFVPGSSASALSGDQAGAHADLTTTLQFTQMGHGVVGEENLPGHPREVVADAPPGLIGNVADMPRCPLSAFSNEGACPLGTQVGVTTVAGFTVPVFNLTTNRGEIARVGFDVASALVEGSFSLRPGDYGVRATFQSINEGEVEIAGSQFTLWGTPAAKIHDPMRGLLCAAGFCSYVSAGTSTGNLSTLPNGQSSTSPAVPYLTSPTQCTGQPLPLLLTANSWEEPEREVATAPTMGPLTGCELLDFSPELTGAPDTTRADTPAGYTFNLRLPQEGLTSATGLSASDIEDTTVTLPPGVAINPGQAAGLGACRLSQAAIGVEGPPSCPSGSNIGHVEIRTPLLKEKVEGNVYLLASNPPHLKILVAPEDPQDGIYVKFVGNVELDQATGQVTTTFEKTPQLPISNLKLSFSGGAQAGLSTPTECGTHTIHGTLTPWSGGPAAPVQSSFAIETGPGGAPCTSPHPYDPSLVAGPTTDQAGGLTDFSLLLSRADGQQRISTLSFKTPPGLLGKVGSVPLCGAAAAAAGDCPAASQIGETVVESGPGPYPLVVPQPGRPEAPIYLTGPFKGSPYGLLVKVPLLVGPFDLGTELVRSKIEVDPETSQLTITTDPLPQIIDGVPTDVRALYVNVDRPDFMINPTNCEESALRLRTTSIEGAVATPSSRIQVGGCAALGFRPKLRLSLSGPTRRAGLPKLKAVVTPRPGDANIGRTVVTLPPSEFLEQGHIGTTCTRVQFNEGGGNGERCPAKSIYGRAKAITPLLSEPFEGPVYLRSNGGERKLPDLVAALHSGGVDINLVGFIDSVRKKGSEVSRIRNTFATVPDAPVTRFTLEMFGGKKGLLVNSENLCSPTAQRRADARFTGQNGKVDAFTPTVTNQCKSKKKHKSRGHA